MKKKAELIGHEQIWHYYRIAANRYFEGTPGSRPKRKKTPVSDALL
jgi:hypothetical protein